MVLIVLVLVVVAAVESAGRVELTSLISGGHKLRVGSVVRDGL